MQRLISVLFYVVVIIIVGYVMLQYSDWFWLGAAGLLMLLSVGLGRIMRKR